MGTGHEGDAWRTDLDLLTRRLRPFGIHLDDTQTDLISRYCAELLAWNGRYGLLSKRDVGGIVRKHVAASLGSALLVTPNPREEWVDVGSGAGLPGIILKFWAPDQPITLIEGSQKKCVFLEHARRQLGLGRLTILAKRVETLLARQELIGAFDTLFARAVADLPDTLRDFGPLVRGGGRIVTFKGPAWERDVRAAEEAGLLMKGKYRLCEVIRVPWGPGHILAIRKEITETD